MAAESLAQWANRMTAVRTDVRPASANLNRQTLEAAQRSRDAEMAAMAEHQERMAERAAAKAAAAAAARPTRPPLLSGGFFKMFPGTRIALPETPAAPSVTRRPGPRPS